MGSECMSHLIVGIGTKFSNIVGGGSYVSEELRAKLEEMFSEHYTIVRLEDGETIYGISVLACSSGDSTIPIGDLGGLIAKAKKDMYQLLVTSNLTIHLVNDIYSWVCTEVV